MSDSPRLPSLYIPHGGGPCFFMEPMPGAPPDLWAPMAAYLRGIAASLPARPRAVLVISAHWETERPSVHVAPRPTLLYDYYGFPEHTYQLSYPVAGAPAVAARVEQLLQARGLGVLRETLRGLDHGVFIPFKLIYPDADVPITQLSLNRSLDAGWHVDLGRALAPLRDEGVLIVGSGMSYHNLHALFSPAPQPRAAAVAFDDWLTRTVCEPDPQARAQGLAAWAAAPGGRASHPREEHLMPLMVAAGAGGADPARRDFNDALFGKPVSAYRFG